MSFQQGLSGLNASSRNLEVIGHNIANASTIGSKMSRAEFSDLYANAFNGTTSTNPGIGVYSGVIAQQFTQGNITTTNVATDIAINGNGFFQVTDGASPVQYTRNGQFKISKEGYLVNNQGMKLVGYPADSKGTVIPGSADAIKLPTAGIEPTATTLSKFEANLDSRAAPTTTLAPAAAKVNIQDPKTFNNATSTTVYDVKGQPVTLTYYFQKTSTDTWNVYATANGQSIYDDGTGTKDPVTAMTPIATVKFPVAGTSPIAPSGSVTPYSYVPPAAPVAGTPSVDGIITLPDIPAVTLGTGGLSEAILGTKLDLAGLSQTGSSFGITLADVDGNAPGNLTGVSINGNGELTARYSNGQTKVCAQIELATFRNPNGLQPVGGNSWQMSAASGTPIRNVPGEGNLGALQSGALEESNVDLTSELVNMMTAQRVYQANAQTVKTQDQVLNTLVNLR